MPNTSFAKKKWCVLYQDYIVTKINFCIVSGNSLTKTSPDEIQGVTHKFYMFRETSLNSWHTNIHTNQAALEPAFNLTARYYRGNVLGDGTRFLKKELHRDKDLTENGKFLTKPINEYTLNSPRRRETSHHCNVRQPSSCQNSGQVSSDASQHEL